MTNEELAAALAEINQEFPEGSRETAALLFGVKYANQLEGFSVREIAEIAERAGIRAPTRSGLIRKAVKLGPYVRVLCRGRCEPS